MTGALVVTLVGLVLTGIITPFFVGLGTIAVASIFYWVNWNPVVSSKHPPEQPKQRFRIVVPAHNEADIIESTLSSLQHIDYPKDQFEITVVADNCTDETAQIAQSMGVTVLVRQDASKKCKGYALAYAFQTVIDADCDVDAYVVIDADTQVDPNLLTAFSGYLDRGWDWIQSNYQVGNPDQSWRTQLMALGFSLFNGIWLMGQDQLGMSVSLRGNGMCFSRAGLLRFPWCCFGLAEDMEFGWMLRLNGERVHFAPDAIVRSNMLTQAGDAAVSQRQRWELGRATVRKTFSTGLFLVSDQPLTAALYWLDLNFIPLSRLVMGWMASCAAWSLAAVLWGAVPGWIIVVGVLHVVYGATLLVYISLPVMLGQLPIRTLAAMAHLPAYCVWKLWVLIQKRPAQWVRTTREMP